MNSNDINILNEFTFQVNLSPGDVPYANLTVRKLVDKHKNIPNRLLVVDCCGAQKTNFFNPNLICSDHEFSSNVEKIINIANDLLNEGYFTNVYFLYPGDPLFKSLSNKYLNNIYLNTHGAGGTAQMSYWAGIELSNTRYVVHFDGDMLFYQDKDYQWYIEAIKLMENDDSLVFAVPPLAPSLKHHNYISHHLIDSTIDCGKYWRNIWFSTRIFLVDKKN